MKEQIRENVIRSEVISQEVGHRIDIAPSENPGVLQRRTCRTISEAGAGEAERDSGRNAEPRRLRRRWRTRREEADDVEKRG